MRAVVGSGPGSGGGSGSGPQKVVFIQSNSTRQKGRVGLYVDALAGVSHVSLGTSPLGLQPSDLSGWTSGELLICGGSFAGAVPAERRMS